MSCRDIILSTVEFPKQMELTDIHGDKYIFPEDVWCWFGECKGDYVGNDSWSGILNKMGENIPQYRYFLEDISFYDDTTDEKLKLSYIRRNSLIFIFFREMMVKFGADIWFGCLWTHIEHGTGEGLEPIDFNITPFIENDPIAHKELYLEANTFYRFVLK